jgi:hypothetical protein
MPTREKYILYARPSAHRVGACETIFVIASLGIVIA